MSYCIQKRISHWVRAGWLWPLVLLALPNCAQVLGVEDWNGGGRVFDPGPVPQTSAIMCDIPYVPDPSTVPCADALDVMNGMSKEYGAVALAQGELNSLALDYSPAATAQCPNTAPLKIAFYGPFPDGYTVCLNAATQIPAVYQDGNEVCIAKCQDLINLPGGFTATGGAEAFCKANAHVSTNFDKHTPFPNACSFTGIATMDPKDDPRRIQEPVIWIPQNGTKAGDVGNNITRTAARSGLFDAGAYSEQTFTHGDGWVEFEVSLPNKQYAVGVSPGAADGDETLADMAFALVLQDDGQIYVFEGGSQVGGSFGPYSPGDRFRVRVNDNKDAKASIVFTQLNGPCTKGTVCNETSFSAGSAPNPPYPLRVNVSLVDPGAFLNNVTLVRIQDLP